VTNAEENEKRTCHPTEYSGLNVKDQIVMCTEFLIGLIGDHVSWDSANHGCRKSGVLTRIVLERPWEFRFDISMVAALVKDDEGSVYQVGLLILDFD